MRNIKILPDIEGCSDHDCVFGHPGGMGTNGGCACLKDFRSITMKQRFIKNIFAYRKRIRDLQEQIAKLEEKYEAPTDQR
jgi:hypothetical protein